jgi:hypothetical protein
MPRDGSGVFHRPPGTDGVPNTTISSAAYNVWVADVEQDLNLPRPIVAGGTGAATADDALTAFGGEKASQVVTNYDSQVWIAGSFYSAATATGAPVSGHAFAGQVYKDDAGDWILEARDMTDPAHPVYTRAQSGGTWAAWGASLNVGTDVYAGTLAKPANVASGTIMANDTHASLATSGAVTFNQYYNTAVPNWVAMKDGWSASWSMDITSGTLSCWIDSSATAGTAPATATQVIEVTSGVVNVRNHLLVSTGADVPAANGTVIASNYTSLANHSFNAYPAAAGGWTVIQANYGGLLDFEPGSGRYVFYQSASLAAGATIPAWNPAFYIAPTYVSSAVPFTTQKSATVGFASNPPTLYDSGFAANGGIFSIYGAVGFNAYSTPTAGNWVAAQAGYSAYYQMDISNGTLNLMIGSNVAAGVVPSFAPAFYAGSTEFTIQPRLRVVSGRIISQASSGNPSIMIYNTGVSTCAGMYVDATGVLSVGLADANGVPSAVMGYWNNANGTFSSSYGIAYKPGGGSWTAPSDARIKQDIAPYTLGLAELVQLKPVSYRFRPETGYHENDLAKTHVGLVAQDVEQVMPDLVSVGKAKAGSIELDDFRMLDPSALTYALINAIKELTTRLAAAETEIVDLRDRVADLEEEQGGGNGGNGENVANPAHIK